MSNSAGTYVNHLCTPCWSASTGTISRCGAGLSMCPMPRSRPRARPRHPQHGAGADHPGAGAGRGGCSRRRRHTRRTGQINPCPSFLARNRSAGAKPSPNARQMQSRPAYAKPSPEMPGGPGAAPPTTDPRATPGHRLVPEGRADFLYLRRAESQSQGRPAGGAEKIFPEKALHFSKLCIFIYRGLIRCPAFAAGPGGSGRAGGRGGPNRQRCRPGLPTHDRRKREA